MLDCVTRRSEKLGFLKCGILPDITVKSFVFGVIRNCPENYYFETSLTSVNFIIDTINRVYLIIFCDCPLEKFQLV